MAESRTFEIVTDSFLDGVTGAALFGKLRRPGAPTEFADTRPSVPTELSVSTESKQVLERDRSLSPAYLASTLKLMRRTLAALTLLLALFGAAIGIAFAISVEPIKWHQILPSGNLLLTIRQDAFIAAESFVFLAICIGLATHSIDLVTRSWRDSNKILESIRLTRRKGVRDDQEGEFSRPKS